MDTTYQNDPWSSLHALLLCPMFIFNSIDAVILHHAKDLIECSWEVSRCFIYGQKWTFRVMTHHYHSHQHDDDTIAKVHY